MSTKTCGQCHQEKPLSEFGIRNKATGLRKSKCRSCCQAYAKTHYAGNKQTYVDKAARSNEKARATNNDYVRLSLVGKACTRCAGNNDLLYYQGQGATEQPVHMAAHAALALDRVKEAIARSQVVCRPCLQKSFAGGGFAEWSALTQDKRVERQATRTEPPSRVADPGRYKAYRPLPSAPGPSSVSASA